MAPDASSWGERLALRALERVGSARLVMLIDGGSGSGKTSLARAFATRYPRPVQVVGLDECYPGWHGLAAGAALVPGMLTGSHPGYQRWDWATSAPAGWVDLDATKDIVVEGCGALSSESSRLANLTVWCQRDAVTRKRLALARDGDMFRPHWDEWATQEAQLWRRNRPRTLADVIVRLN